MIHTDFINKTEENSFSSSCDNNDKFQINKIQISMSRHFSKTRSFVLQMEIVNRNPQTKSGRPHAGATPRNAV
jgi:hypothetical protein